MPHVKIFWNGSKESYVLVDGHRIPASRVEVEVIAGSNIPKVRIEVPATELIVESTEADVVVKGRVKMCGIRGIPDHDTVETWCGRRVSLLQGEQSTTGILDDVGCADCRGMMANKEKYLTVHTVKHGATLCGWAMATLPEGDRWTPVEEFQKSVEDWFFPSEPEYDREVRKCQGCVDAL